MKTPGELKTLRSVYGARLVVIGVYSPRDMRIKHLEQQIRTSRQNEDQSTWAHQAEDLISRDEKEELEGGQDVSGTFHHADFFVRGWSAEVAREDLERILEVLFGSPFRTPTRDEYGQLLAAGAALRSAEFGRQVGAAIATEDGSVVALGTNEVPIAGGGSHWEEDGNGNRDFEVGDVDTNRRHLDALVQRLADTVGETVVELIAGGGTEHLRRNLQIELPKLLRGAGLKDLTEFGRSTHAEMNALLDAARRGVPVSGTTLYTTTFPCHNCARHIIAAGIRRVVYIEPYPKSKAAELHEDAVRIDTSGPADDQDQRVAFEPFVGVAPRRYFDLFDAGLRERLERTRRKDEDGRKPSFVKTDAVPILPDAGLADFIPAFREYRARELAALDYFNEHTEGESVRTGKDNPCQTTRTTP